MTVVAQSTSLPNAVTFRRRQSTSSTSGYLTTDCCNGRWSSLTRLHSTRRSLVAHGVNSLPTLSVSVCSHHYSATLTCGHRSTSTIWRNCMTISLPGLPTCSINSHRAVVDRRIPGSTRTVGGLPLPSRLGVWGSVVSSPAGSGAKSPGRQRFWYIMGLHCKNSLCIHHKIKFVKLVL